MCRLPSLRCIAVVVIAGVLGCGASESATPDSERASEKLSVFAVHYPLKFMAERIGGEQVEVECPPAGPEWRPDTATIVALQKKDCILLNGAGYAAWMDSISLADSKRVDVSAHILGQLATREKPLTHTHGPGDQNDLSFAATTIWLDPKLAIEQARAIAADFSHRMPGKQREFAQRLAALENELNQLNDRLNEAIQPWRETPVVLGQPRFQYIQKRFGLSTMTLTAPDELRAEDIATAAKFILDAKPALMVVTKPPPEDVLRLASEAGLATVVYDLCETEPAEGDFLSVMRANCGRLAQAAAKKK